MTYNPSTRAVDAAAAKLYELALEGIAKDDPKGVAMAPRYGDLKPIQKYELRSNVLPLVTAAAQVIAEDVKAEAELEALERKLEAEMLRAERESNG